MQMLPAAKAVDDGNKGTIVSLGPRTDSVIDRYQLSDKQIIPAIRILSRSMRNSSWEKHLQGSKFNLSYEQAHNLSGAMHGDLGVSNDDVRYYPLAEPDPSSSFHPPSYFSVPPRAVAAGESSSYLFFF
ncbi:hypothetical protein DXG01_009832 [Tephrocybe rancida]|nr:hypothetical protein DXG01_009832 [Tephrocybe rancida]